MVTRTHNIVHEEHVPGYDPSLYKSKRLYAIGTDGTAIPLSLVWRKDLYQPQTGANPLVLHAYGAYGYPMNPIFSAARLSLLDRGFIFAVAHVRGGNEMGNRWYHEGKLLKKKNTIEDFIKSAEYLVKVRIVIDDAQNTLITECSIHSEAKMPGSHRKATRARRNYPCMEGQQEDS